MHIPRRTFLKGTGAALALPMLEAMLPGSAFAAAPARPRRLACIFFPNGAIMPDWKPTQVGANFEFTPTLKALAPLRDDILITSGLVHDKGRSNGDGAGDHARSSASFLTGAQPRKTSGADIFVGTSVDQVVAAQIGHQTKLPSLELGTEPGRQAGRCDSGYSCAYQSNISWKTPTTPMAKEVNPRLVFERMFGRGGSPDAARERDFYRKSILDFVAADAERLTRQLGRSDRRKMDEYLTSVREIEQRIERAEIQVTDTAPEMELPDSPPSDVREHIRLMYDLMALAFETDTTRVVTLMLANSGSNRSYPHLDVRSGHHQLTHHQGNEENIRQIRKIDKFLAEEFARFLTRLKTTKEGGASLLDQCAIVYGSGLSDANRHRHEDLPIIIAGRCGGAIQPGRHLEYGEIEGDHRKRGSAALAHLSGQEVPMTNLYLSLIDAMGAQAKDFGDSNGRLPGLAG